MKYALNVLCSLERKQHDHFGDIHFIRKAVHRDDVIIIDASTANVFEQIRSNKDLTEDIETKNADGIARLVAENILIPLKGSPSKVIVPIAKHINLWLQVTDSCNLACDYCYIPSLYSDRTLRSDIFSLLFRHFKDIKGLETVHLKLAGGEPLMVFSVWKEGVLWLRAQLDSIGINLELRLITNLTRLTNEMISFFKQHKVIISVSVDGLGSAHDQHRKYRNGTGSFSSVMANIERLREHGILPSVMITVASDNYLGVPSLVEYLIERDMTFRVSDAKGGYLTSAQFEQTMDAVCALLDQAVGQGYPVSRRVIFSDLRTHEVASTPCSMGRHAAAIYLDGSVYFCHTEFQKGQALGHLNDDQNLLNIIRTGKHKHLGLSDDCQECQYRFVCAGGCPLYRVNGKSIMCHVYKKIISQVFGIYDREGERKHE
ncbi:radical SAM/SPASM domain-containing protein [Photobacterium phosphoreum]|uniref:radical SAM/SPASM domain-containing protein n=1 Tax=Photobacterium phosphoreum TaxID=659 RepID=UPI0024B72DAE|nr:radical SAM protein [Photobacterium phosphoreum]